MPASPVTWLTERTRKAREARAFSTMSGNAARISSPTCRSTAKLSLPPSQ
jgi:hypothetical protein